MTRLYSKLAAAMFAGMSSTMVLADLPATVPAPANQSAPTNQPAPVNQTAPAVRQVPRVEVFPFTAVSNQPGGQDWTGRGIQENLQSDVSHTGATLTIAPHLLAPTDDAMAIAKQAHSDLAVTGTYQIVGDQIRANGQLIDVATNTPIGGFSATGSQHDLFKIEDALGEQLRSLLPRQLSEAQAQQLIQQPQPQQQLQPGQTTDYEAPATTVYASAPQPVYNNYYQSETAPTPSYYYPDYSYSAYPSSYGYGGYYGGFGFYPGFVTVIGGGRFNEHGGRGFDHGHDGFHDHGFVGGGRGSGLGNTGFRGSVGGIVRGPVGTASGRGGFSVGRTGGVSIGRGGGIGGGMGGGGIGGGGARGGGGGGGHR